MAVTHGDEQAPSEEDPFAGLVLDESFVQAAKVSEAPARTRDAIARFAHLEHPVIGTGRPPERGPRSKKRRWITVTAVVMVAALLGYIVWLTGRPAHATNSGAPLSTSTPSTGGQQPTTPPKGSSTPAPQPSELGNWPAKRTVGECLMWKPEEHAPVTVVPCSQSHVAQLTANIDVSGHFGVAWPGDKALGRLTDQMCLKPFETFTGLSPSAAAGLGYVSSSLDPTQKGWAVGSRKVICTVIKFGYQPFTGSAQGLGKPVST